MKRFLAGSNNMASSPQRIYLATGNAHKVQEFQQLAEMSEAKIEFVRPVTMPVVVEDTGTFIGNARKKALALKAILPPEAWVLADDSGLCVDALGGGPGVESAYYAGPQSDAAANLAKLVKVLRAVPHRERHAHFICVLALIRDSVREDIFEGRCDGSLLSEPKGGFGFGYDPLFVPAGHEKSLAEIGEAFKNQLSHRSRAWEKLHQEVVRVR